MLERLLRSLYSALDASPRPQIALRLRHPDKVLWSVQGRKLALRTEAGASWPPLDLRTLDFTGLAQWLEAHGFTVLYRNHDLASRSAASLISGASGESLSNGDALLAYDSLVWSLLDACAVELEDVAASIDEALRQLYIETAEGDWLDYWGEFFGLPREARGDDPYRRFLIDETLRPRSNAIAIEKAVKELVGKTIKIHEPWKEMFVLDESALSDLHHFQDGNYYTYCIIEPTSIEPLDWTDVLPVIRRNKPAGVISVSPATIFPARLLDFHYERGEILRSGEEVHSALVVYEDRPRLSYWALDSEVVRNYPFFSTDRNTHETLVELYSTTPASRPRWTGRWDSRPWSGSHAFYPSSEVI